MKQAHTKTNAVRIVEQQKVSYEIYEYEVDEHDLSAKHLAETTGVAPEMLFKTITLTGNVTPYLVAVIPATNEVNLKKLAQASGNKKCELLPLKELTNVTGYIRGGCSPVGMKKTFPTFIDAHALEQEAILVSAGKRGLQMKIAPKDLAKVADAAFADLV